jgi:DNA-binding NarL/FixJ family response regulator
LEVRFAIALSRYGVVEKLTANMTTSLRNPQTKGMVLQPRHSTAGKRVSVPQTSLSPIRCSTTRTEYMAQAITVLLVDDHALVRRAFRRILEDEGHITIVGEAGDGSKAIQLARELKPKVILMDLAMPGMSGLDATREILATCPQCSILILSMHAEDTWVQQSAKAGAHGYILKNADGLDLGSAINRVAAGELVFDGLLPASYPKGKRRCRLSPRELEVLQLIVDGKSTKEIASHLRLSENTVGAHRANIMRELGVRKTAEVVVYAIRERLVNIS